MYKVPFGFNFLRYILFTLFSEQGTSSSDADELEKKCLLLQQQIHEMEVEVYY